MSLTYDEEDEEIDRWEDTFNTKEDIRQNEDIKLQKSTYSGELGAGRVVFPPIGAGGVLSIGAGGVLSPTIGAGGVTSPTVGVKPLSEKRNNEINKQKNGEVSGTQRPVTHDSGYVGAEA